MRLFTKNLRLFSHRRQSRLLLPPKTPLGLLLRRVLYIGVSRRLVFCSPASRSGCGNVTVLKSLLSASFSPCLRSAGTKILQPQIIHRSQACPIFTLRNLVRRRATLIQNSVSPNQKTAPFPCPKGGGRPLSVLQPSGASPFAPLADGSRLRHSAFI
jgi:hypothetical protein